MATLRVIVAGGRGFTDYQGLCKTLDYIFRKALDRGDDVITISGTARGVDEMGERYAATRGLKCERMPANWDRYGKSAGYKRNESMAKVATHLIAFWDGNSRGTKHMIDIARHEGLTIRVIDYDGNYISLH